MDIAQRITVIIAILPVRGASTVIPSIDARKPVPAAARLPTIMLTTAIPMVHGPARTIRSISVPKRALPVVIPAMNTLTIQIQTAMANATIAVQPSA